MFNMKDLLLRCTLPVAIAMQRFSRSLSTTERVNSDISLTLKSGGGVAEMTQQGQVRVCFFIEETQSRESGGRGGGCRHPSINLGGHLWVGVLQKLKQKRGTTPGALGPWRGGWDPPHPPGHHPFQKSVARISTGCGPIAPPMLNLPSRCFGVLIDSFFCCTSLLA